MSLKNGNWNKRPVSNYFGFIHEKMHFDTFAFACNLNKF